MKIKATMIDCHLIIRVKMSFGEYIDEALFERFSRAGLKGFLKPSRVRKSVIEYKGPIGITLFEYFKKPIIKHDFLLIIEQIVLAAQKIQTEHLPLDKILFDIRNVYINEVTKELQFLYIPSSNVTVNHGVTELLETVAYSAVPADEKDSEVISKFIFFLRNLKNFDVGKIEGFVFTEDKSVLATVKNQNKGQSGFMTNKMSHYYEHYEENDEATGLLEEDEATGLLADEQTTLLCEETGLLTEEDGTALLMEDNDGTALLEESIHYATLVRILTGETITVNKAVFRLGKERSYVDYFVTNNNAVSRSHADIVTRGNRYFVIDLNSKNRTYINDRPIMPHCETEINEGDVLRLGNEEFIFYL